MLDSKNIVRNIAILISPFLFMIIVNEYSRDKIIEKPYTVYGITAMNSDVRTPDKCSWSCFKDTGYCKKNHTALMNDFYKQIDPIYFGIISFLQASGDYSTTNIIFLVILWPFIMFFLLVKSLNIQKTINLIKKKNA